jgi:hypothetical protein
MTKTLRKAVTMTNSAANVIQANRLAEQSVGKSHFYQCKVCGGFGCFQRLSGELYAPNLCPVNLGGSEWKEVSPKTKRGFHVTKNP